MLEKWTAEVQLIFEWSTKKLIDSHAQEQKPGMDIIHTHCYNFFRWAPFSFICSLLSFKRILEFSSCSCGISPSCLSASSNPVLEGKLETYQTFTTGTVGSNIIRAADISGATCNRIIGSSFIVSTMLSSPRLR